METPIINSSDILGLGVSTLIVVAAVVGLGWLYSRIRLPGGGSANIINIVASQALGPKERLLLIEVGDKQLLVGLTSSQLSTLHTFEDRLSVEKESAESPGFLERLRSAQRGVAK